MFAASRVLGQGCHSLRSTRKVRRDHRVYKRAWVETVLLRAWEGDDRLRPREEHDRGRCLGSADGCDEPKRSFEVGAIQRRRQRCAQVVSVLCKPCGPFDFPGTLEVGRDLGEVVGVVARVPASGDACDAAGLEMLLCVLADGLEQPVSARWVAFVSDNQGLFDEVTQQVEDVNRVDAISADDRLRGARGPTRPRTPKGDQAPPARRG